MAKTLRQIIAENAPLIVPSIYDGISALVLKEFDFKAAYIGSYATGATRYGVADIGYIGVEDMADQVRRLSSIIEVPIIVDGEGGWGNPLHVARSVRLLERAGAAATHIEDHEFGKHVTAKPRVIPVGRAVDKIKAALDARASEDFLVIARTDSAGAEGPDAAIDRLLAYQEAGADGLFMAGVLNAEQKQRLRSEATVPLVAPDFPGLTTEDYEADGTAVVLYYGLSHLAAQAAYRDAFSVLAKERSSVSLDERLVGIPAIMGFDSFLGVAQVREDARKYGLTED
ncbi:oxaloacetate decarboxylase [Streptomyces sp. NPDC051569]|uniref:oxaloacetate decarboxylase n=1 Tax=Streptomyces sp. NPDC051569 TaxID=3365661 RepID=UPI00379E5F1E